MPGRGTGRSHRLFGACGGNNDSQSEQQWGGKSDSFHGSHDTCSRWAAVNPP